MTDGQLFTVPAKLTERQRIVYARVTLNGEGTPMDAGLHLHLLSECRHCNFSGLAPIPCQYAESAGRQVLEALRKKGLLRRDRHHVYRLAAEPAAISPVLTPEEEFGF